MQKGCSLIAIYDAAPKWICFQENTDYIVVNKSIKNDVFI